MRCDLGSALCEALAHLLARQDPDLDLDLDLMMEVEEPGGGHLKRNRGPHVHAVRCNGNSAVGGGGDVDMEVDVNACARERGGGGAGWRKACLCAAARRRGDAALEEVSSMAGRADSPATASSSAQADSPATASSTARQRSREKQAALRLRVGAWVLQEDMRVWQALAPAAGMTAFLPGAGGSGPEQEQESLGWSSPAMAASPAGGSGDVGSSIVAQQLSCAARAPLPCPGPPPPLARADAVARCVEALVHNQARALQLLRLAFGGSHLACESCQFMPFQVDGAGRAG